MIRTDPEAMAIAFLSDRLALPDWADEAGASHPSVGTEPPREWHTHCTAHTPYVHARRTGGRPEPHCLGGKVNPIENVTFSIDVWGGEKHTTPSAVNDPATGVPFLSPKAEVQYIAQMVAAACEKPEGFTVSGRGSIAGGSVDIMMYQADGLSDRPRYVLTVRLKVRTA